MENFLNDFTDRILDYHISIDIIADYLTFEAAILAIVIPLSIDIVTRLSERFKTDIITKQFFNERKYKNLLIILFFSIVYSVSIRIIIRDDDIDTFSEAIFAFIGYLLFISAIIIFWFYIKLIMSYVRNMDKRMEKLFSDVENILKK